MSSSNGKSAYGTKSASDTSFRKTWDREEYAKKAQEERDAAREESKARYEAKLAGKRYHKHVDLSQLDDTSARGSRIDVASMVGKSTIIPAGSAVGRRGRGAGFYCEACDLTYKDNIQYVEHLNSKQHLIATGQSGEVKRATLEEVRERLGLLIERKRRAEEEAKRDNEVDLGARLKMREEEEMQEREERRRRRNEKRRRRGSDAVKDEEFVSRLGIIT